MKTNVDTEKELTKYVRKLQYDLSRKDQMIQVQCERILEVEGEIKKYNGLLAAVAGLENEVTFFLLHGLLKQPTEQLRSINMT